MNERSNAGRILNIILDVVVAAVIVFWAYLLYREFNQLPLSSENRVFSVFNIKVLLFSLFLIASITSLFYFNVIFEKRSRPDAEQNSFAGNSDRKVIDALGEIRELLNKRPVNAAVEVPKEQKTGEQLEEKITRKFDLAQRIFLVKDVNELFTETIQLCGNLVGAKRVSLFLTDPEKKKLVCVKKCGVFSGEKEGIETNGGLDWYVHSQGKRMYATNVETHPEISRKNDPKYRTKSLIILPLRIFGDEKVGVLNMTEKEENEGIFTKSDLEFANLLAAMFEQKMENLVLYDSLDSLIKDKPPQA